MQHNIAVTKLSKEIGPQVEDMARAIESCVHCGFCLPVCPTYSVLEEEMDSPRGRIMLMKSVLEEDITVQEATPYIDRCLGCLACVTACPSGVKYEALISPYRAYANKQVERTVMDRIQRKLLVETLPYPKRFRTAANLGKWVKPLNKTFPREIRDMIALMPDRLAERYEYPSVVPAIGNRRARVALLLGCVQQVIAPEINQATIRVLAKNGVEVVIPADQACCGALSIHTGDHDRARELASHNLRIFPSDVDAILTNAAGCGSGMKEYGSLFKGLKEEENAREFAHNVNDVSEFLYQLGIIEPSSLPQALKCTYHDACHLAHAQGVVDPPRRLLNSIPNLTLLEIADEGICCGSAGAYNLEQPEIANALGQRKVQKILESGGDVVVTGNIGCMVQIRAHLHSLGNTLPVFHTIEILDKAYSTTDISIF